MYWQAPLSSLLALCRKVQHKQEQGMRCCFTDTIECNATNEALGHEAEVAGTVATGANRPFPAIAWICSSYRQLVC